MNPSKLLTMQERLASKLEKSKENYVQFQRDLEEGKLANDLEE